MASAVLFADIQYADDVQHAKFLWAASETAFERFGRKFDDDVWGMEQLSVALALFDVYEYSNWQFCKLEAGAWGFVKLRDS